MTAYKLEEIEGKYHAAMWVSLESGYDYSPFENPYATSAEAGQAIRQHRKTKRPPPARIVALYDDVEGVFQPYL